MKCVEMLVELYDLPMMSDVKICLFGECGKMFEFEVDKISTDKSNDIIIISKHKEKRETGFEPVTKEK